MRFDVVAFEAAGPALDHAREAAAAIALVVADHFMPGMTDIEVADSLREAIRHADLSAMIATLTR